MSITTYYQHIPVSGMALELCYTRSLVAQSARPLSKG